MTSQRAGAIVNSSSAPATRAAAARPSTAAKGAINAFNARARRRASAAQDPRQRGRAGCDRNRNSPPCAAVGRRSAEKILLRRYGKQRDRRRGLVPRIGLCELRDGEVFRVDGGFKME